MVGVRQAVVQKRLRQSGQRGPSKVPVPLGIPQRSEERKLRPTERPDGACRPRGKLELSKLVSTIAWRLEKAPQNYAI